MKSLNKELVSEIGLLVFIFFHWKNVDFSCVKGRMQYWLIQINNIEK